MSRSLLTKPSLIILCLLALPSLARSQERYQEIVYTGRLLGYFRIPDLQSREIKRCPRIDLADRGDGTENYKPSAAALKFIQEKSKNGLNGAILVGTGDNFAPRLEARTFDPRPGQNGQFVPANKELYFWDRENKVWSNQLENDIPAYIAHGEGTVPVDNVGCFLSAAGYKAVVPGKHDFYFGPERLRQLARFLARNDVDSYHAVQMLGANLLISTSTVNEVTPAEDKTKWGWPKEYSLLNVQDGASVYPWFSRIRVKLQEFGAGSEALKQLSQALGPTTTEKEFLNVVARVLANTPNKSPDYEALSVLQTRVEQFRNQNVFICRAGKDPREITLNDNCTKLDRWVSKSVVRLPRLKITTTGRLVVYEWALDTEGKPFASVLAGQNYGLILSPSVTYKTCKDKDGPKCIRFTVHRPFFSFPHEIPDKSDPMPYRFLEDRNAVIFGVVDAALGEHVGALNFSWRNDNPKLKTVVSVTDPAEALKEQVDYFNLWYEQKYGKQFRGLKILLAQINPHSSRLLASNFPEFQVVVSAADEPQATTELEQSTVWTGKTRAGAFVAVPHPYFDPSQADTKEGVIHFGSLLAIDQSSGDNTKWKLTSETHVQVPVDRQPIAKRSSTNVEGSANTARDPNNSEKLLNRIKFVPGETPVSPTTPIREAPLVPPTFRSRLTTTLNNCMVNWPSSDADSDLTLLKLLTLCTMRKQTAADVALIQKRDFFDDLPLTPDDIEIQRTIDRAIWKGDLLTLLYVPGASLKQALAKSKAFDGEDSAVISLSDERLRGLEFIGAKLDEKKKEYLINEVPLDDKKLYAVATTDYIGAGDTGYPELAAAALNPKSRAMQFPAELQPISSLVCRELLSDYSKCLPFFPRDRYLDESVAEETTPVQPAGLGQKVREIIPFKWPGPAFKPGSTKEAVEEAVQRRPIWMLSLNNLSVGYTSLFHNRTDKEIKETFAGVSSPSVTAETTHTWTVALDTRFSRSSHSYEFFLASSIDFREQSTGDVTQDIVQLGNRVTGDYGMIWNLRGGRSQKRVGLNFSLHTETQLQRPFTKLTLNSGDTLKVTQDRSFQFLPRFGGRWQNLTNTFEIGLQGGWEFRAVNGYQFDTNGTVVQCLPDAAKSLATCIKELSAVPPGLITTDSVATAIQKTRPRTGMYWKTALSFPIDKKVTYDFTDEGDFFFVTFSGDNSSDTWIRDLSKHSLKFAVWPNFSIGPSLQLLIFKNKVNRDLLVQKQFGFEASFSFNLFNRREKSVQLKHKP